MERYNGVEPDPEGAFVYYDDAQRALDAERARVKELQGAASTPINELLAELISCAGVFDVSTDYEDDRKALETATQAVLDHVATLQAQLADRDAMILQMGEQAAVLAKENMAVKAQLRQAEGQSQQQAEEAVIVFAKYTTLRQLVEALPVVDGRMDVECGACYYIRSFIAGQYGVVCGLITEQSTAMAIKALLEYRATQAAQDAGAKLPAWVNEAMRLAPTQTNPPHPTEERS
jgi:hypothetical protein